MTIHQLARQIAEKIDNKNKQSDYVFAGSFLIDLIESELLNSNLDGLIESQGPARKQKQETMELCRAYFAGD
jgi:hypothetical protein